jgi:hypothetical protein
MASAVSPSRQWFSTVAWPRRGVSHGFAEPIAEITDVYTFILNA